VITSSDDDRAYQLELGKRLREVRKGLGLSLAAVEEKSGGRWSGVVVGSYERGDRSITIARLHGLCAFYGMSPSAVLPEQRVTPADLRDRARLVLQAAIEMSAAETAQDVAA
jgi:transcriptional regulator with XRE-family HTH domain